MNKGITSSQTFELVYGSDEGVSSFLLEIVGNVLSKSNKGVESSSDGSSALSNLMAVLKRLNDALFGLFELVDVGSKLLTKSERSGVLSVCATNLDNVVELVALCFKSIL